MSSKPPVTTIPNTFRMWSKTFKPGDGKVKRDVAMSAQVVLSEKPKTPEHFQAQLIQRKKAEIEAKMAGEDRQGTESKHVKEKKPISLSIGKRW